MEYVGIWVVLAIAVGVVAAHRGRNWFLWMLFGLFLSPIIAILLLLVSKDLNKTELAGMPTPRTHVTCPDCAELVRREAKVCKHCSRKLIPQ